jgi:hypothetical protein
MDKIKYGNGSKSQKSRMKNITVDFAPKFNSVPGLDGKEWIIFERRAQV